MNSSAISAIAVLELRCYSSAMKATLTTPLYAQPEVLRVTRLKPAVLQTWVNRGTPKLTEQNPGRGRTRLYSRLDTVKLAIMRRLSDLRVDLAVAREIAEEASAELERRRQTDWNEYLFIRPDEATEKPVLAIIAASPMSKLAVKYGSTIGDPALMRVSDRVEPNRFMFQRRSKPKDIDPDNWVSDDPREHPVNETLRDAWARMGVHAEPVIIFPLGEIVNGTLAQLDALDESRASPPNAPELKPD